MRWLPRCRWAGVGQPEDIWLGGEVHPRDADYFNGRTVDIDGGLNM